MIEDEQRWEITWHVPRSGRCCVTYWCANKIYMYLHVRNFWGPIASNLPINWNSAINGNCHDNKASQPISIEDSMEVTIDGRAICSRAKIKIGDCYGMPRCPRNVIIVSGFPNCLFHMQISDPKLRIPWYWFISFTIQRPLISTRRVIHVNILSEHLYPHTLYLSYWMIRLWHKKNDIGFRLYKIKLWGTV